MPKILLTTVMLFLIVLGVFQGISGNNDGYITAVVMIGIMLWLKWLKTN